jgi:hypothetical protein
MPKWPNVTTMDYISWLNKTQHFGENINVIEF